MKKFLFPAAATILAFGVAATDAPSDAELRLERKAAEFEKSLNPTFEDERAAAAWKEARGHAVADRHKSYREVAQKNRNGVIPATNPPECTYYSTEGICGFPRTMITPYPRIAHVNTVLDFRFPRKLAGFEARYIMVYPAKELGYSIKYIDPESQTVADIYIYDLPASAEGEEAVLVRELRNVAAGINATHRNVRLDEKFRTGHFLTGEKNAFLFFLAEFDSGNFNDRNEVVKCQSFTLLSAKNRKFLKMRLTRSGDDRKVFTDVVNGFLNAFDQRVILDSQTRTRKFEPTETPPVVVTN